MTTALLDRHAVSVLPIVRGGEAVLAFGVVKQALGPVPLPPPPLTPSPIDHGWGVLFEPDTDYAFAKPRTDVVVTGDVVRVGTATSTTITLTIGRQRRTIIATGARVLERNRFGQLHPSDPAPWERIPMAWASAYGGYDGRVAAPRKPRSLPDAIVHATDHPGLYPRNPFGRGYAVLDHQLAGMAMPLLEDPADRLIGERIAAITPERWYLQPRPACWAWTSPVQFPRYAWWGQRPWFPAPEDDALPEVAYGLVPPDLSRRLASQRELANRYWNAAAPDLTFDELPTGLPLTVRGMDPRGASLDIPIPAPPLAQLELAGRVLSARPRLAQIVLAPTHECAHLTWHLVAPMTGPRWIPGIHAAIPLALRVEGSIAVTYEAPRQRAAG